MTAQRVRTGGVLRCCIDDVAFPVNPQVGATVTCKHCSSGGLELVRIVDAEDIEYWQAAWINLGHDWRGPVT